MDTDSLDSPNGYNHLAGQPQRGNEGAPQLPEHDKPNRSLTAPSDGSFSSDPSSRSSSSSSEEDYTIYNRQGRRKTELTNKELAYYALKDRENAGIPETGPTTGISAEPQKLAIGVQRAASAKVTKGSATKTAATALTESDQSRSRSLDRLQTPHNASHSRFQVNRKSEKKQLKDKREALLAQRGRAYHMTDTVA
jgi:hypothetical protein